MWQAESTQKCTHKKLIPISGSEKTILHKLNSPSSQTVKRETLSSHMGTTLRANKKTTNWLDRRFGFSARIQQRKNERMEKQSDHCLIKPTENTRPWTKDEQYWTPNKLDRKTKEPKPKDMPRKETSYAKTKKVNNAKKKIKAKAK